MKKYLNYKIQNSSIRSSARKTTPTGINHKRNQAFYTEANENSSNFSISRGKSLPSFNSLFQKLLESNFEIKSKLDNINKKLKNTENKKEIFISNINININTFQFQNEESGLKEISSNFDINSFRTSGEALSSERKEVVSPFLKSKNHSRNLELLINSLDEMQIDKMNKNIENLEEIKEKELLNESMDEFEKFLEESGLNQIKSEKNHQKFDQKFEYDSKDTPIKFTDFGCLSTEVRKENPSNLNSMMKKKVVFSEKKVIINYDKKGYVTNLFTLCDDGTLEKRISSFRIPKKNELAKNIKSVLIVKNEDIMDNTIKTVTKRKVKNRIKLNKSNSKYLNYENTSKYQNNLIHSQQKRKEIFKNKEIKLGSFNLDDNQKIIKRNIDFLKNLGENKKKILCRLNKSKNLNFSNEQKAKCLCKRFIHNPIKFFTNLPPPIELEKLNISSEALDSYKNSFENSVIYGNLNMSHDGIFNNNSLNTSFEDYFKSRKISKKSKPSKMLIIDKSLSHQLNEDFIQS